MLRADFHIHSNYSFDCNSKLEDIITRCQKVGLNCIAIADHGTAEGALRMRQIAPFPVIVAQEVWTISGEIMGMFLQETIPSYLTVNEAVARIKEQGGLLCIQHPFEITRVSPPAEILESIADQIDIVEIFNARSPMPRMTKAVAFADKYSKVKIAGSDAHTIREIGNVYLEMPEFTNKADFLEALRHGIITGRKASPFVHVSSLLARILKPPFQRKQPKESG